MVLFTEERLDAISLRLCACVDGRNESPGEISSPGAFKGAVTVLDGRTFQCGEGWHSNEKTVRFWMPSPRVPKETEARCYAYTTPYTPMTPLCTVS